MTSTADVSKITMGQKLRLTMYSVLCVKILVVFSSAEDTLNQNYITPLEETPLFINVCVTIHSISDVDTVKTQFSVDATVELFWWVSEVVWKNAQLMMTNNNIDSIEDGLTRPIPLNKMKSFWLPDLYFREAADVVMPATDTPTKNLFIFNMQGTDNGHWGAAMRLKIKQRVIVNCGMTFNDFPVDKHICLLNLQSFSYLSNQEVYMQYMPNGMFSTVPLNYQGPAALLENKVAVTSCEFKSSFTKEEFSGLCVRFYFERVIFYQFVSNYVPSILLVIASFSPYFMSVHSTIDRISASITLFQALLNVYAQARRNFPPVSYITKLDTFILGCTAFVILSLVQSIIVCHLVSEETRHNLIEVEKRRAHEEIASEDRRREGVAMRNIAEMNARTTLCLTDFQRRARLNEKRRIRLAEMDSVMERPKLARRLLRRLRERAPLSAVAFDKFSARILPLLFVMFQLFYWIFYL